MDLLESPFPFSSLDTISLFFVQDDVCIWVLYVHKSNYDSSLHIHTYKCELRFLLTPPHCNIITHTKSPSNYYHFYPAWLCLACKWNEKKGKFLLDFYRNNHRNGETWRNVNVHAYANCSCIAQGGGRIKLTTATLETSFFLLENEMRKYCS